MKVFYLGNNRLGFEVLRWLRSQDVSVVGLALNSELTRKYADQIIEASGLGDANIFKAEDLHQRSTLDTIGSLGADLGVSVFFGTILRENFLSVFPKGCINLHTSFLPYNRGAYPNVWSIIDETPAGVTIHYMDEGVDTGEILAQRKVAIAPTDTGETLYLKLEMALMDLFCNTWGKISDGKIYPIKQAAHTIPVHKREDVSLIDKIDLDRKYPARELINILRARTFPPHKGAYFEIDGSRIYISLNLRYDDEKD